MLKDAVVATRTPRRAAAIASSSSGRHAHAALRPPLAESDLQRALDRNEIAVAFQPIVRLEDRTIAGFETLLRWDHPRFGRLSPVDFMPMAEETGLIVDLTLFALERTARELAAWQRALDVEPPIFASVDVSSRRLLRHDLLHDVKGVITRSGVLPGTLKLEISERLIMENPEYSVQILSASGAGRGPVPRRIRRRLHLVRLSAALPVRHGEDRPQLRAARTRARVRRSCARSSCSRATWGWTWWPKARRPRATRSSSSRSAANSRRATRSAIR